MLNRFSEICVYEYERWNRKNGLSGGMGRKRRKREGNKHFELCRHRHKGWLEESRIVMTHTLFNYEATEKEAGLELT